MIGLGVAGAIVLVALIVLASVLSKIFGDVGGGIDGDQLGLNPPTSSAPGDSGATGGVVKPVRATVFSPEGGADAPALAGLAIDGDHVDDVAHRHLLRPGAVPRLQERCRA